MQIMILDIPSKFKTDKDDWSVDGAWIKDVERVLGKKIKNAKGMNGTQSFRVFITVDNADRKDIIMLERNQYFARGSF